MEFKLALIAAIGTLTGFWGWMGWMVAGWLLCMMLDYLTGITAACVQMGMGGSTGGSALEFQCFKEKNRPGASPEQGAGQGPSVGPQNNILVFTLDTEQPLNGKEACVPPSAATPPAVPAPHRAAFVQDPECKIGVSGCRCAHFEFPGFHQLRHSNDNI